MKIEDFKELKEFHSIMKKIDNMEELSTISDLLDKIMHINKIRNELDKLEGELTQGRNAMFYFFAMKLDEQEVVFAKEKINSRIKYLKKKKAKAEKEEKEKNVKE